MLFNSLAFLVFFPIVIATYWLLPVKFRNAFLLAASYYFYMNWEPAFALLIAASTITTWGCAKIIDKKPENKKLVLTLCLTFNLGLLVAFKYLGFIGDTLRTLLDMAGLGIHVPHFALLLPVGISFYTFQSIGYTIDVYRGTIKAERSFWIYALFVSFFPQLVAGPIERAKNLLPQFRSHHRFDGIRLLEGLRLMTIGYFMKLCVADNVSAYVDAVYNNMVHHNGTSILLATIFFTFQIFCDFGGYSLIAISAARCMGFNLMQNFRQPYLSGSVKDFWRRWHISLSTWFSDYVYIPLGGNRCPATRHRANLFVTFLVSGLWHGANWTYVIWGAYHGILLVLHNIKLKFRRLTLPDKGFGKLFAIGCTFALVAAGWVFFRANSLSDAFLAFKKMATEHGMLYNGDGKPQLALSFIMIFILIGMEFYNERHKITVDTPLKSDNGAIIRSGLSTGILFIVILLCASFSGGQFIYFQF